MIWISRACLEKVRPSSGVHAHGSVDPVKGGFCRRRGKRQEVGLLDGEPVKRTSRCLLVLVPSVMADVCTPCNTVPVLKACKVAGMASIQVRIAS